MKITLNAKETRKLSTALDLIKSAVEQTPFVPKALTNVVTVDSIFTVNADGSSELTIHEKSVETLFESGSEAFVAAGTIIKDAVSGLSAIFKNFDRDMGEASAIVAKRGEAFNRGKQEFYPTTLSADQQKFLHKAILSNDFDSYDHYESEHKNVEAMLKSSVGVACLPSDSELVPYELRLITAARLVKTGATRFYKATREFNVKAEDLQKALK